MIKTTPAIVDGEKQMPPLIYPYKGVWLLFGFSPARVSATAQTLEHAMLGWLNFVGLPSEN